MIRQLDEITDTIIWVEMVYETLAAAVAAGVVLGVAVIWLSVAARGTDAS